MNQSIRRLLALATVSALMLTACTGGKNTGGGTTPPVTPTKTADTQELTLNLGSEPPKLDSVTTTDTVSFDVLNQVNEGLTRTVEGYKIEQGVAESWDISQDGLTYTFKLRKDAKWSDGKPVTSQDFKYAWLRAADPNTAAEYGFFTHYIKGAAEFNTLDLKAADFATKYADLKSKVAITTPDANTLTVTLVGPTPYFLGLMGFPTFLPQREDIVTKFNTKVGDKLEEKYAAEFDKMVYNGPFVISEWKHEDSLVITKNPQYWDAAKVKLEKVNFKMVKDVNTSVQMYETGALDRVALSGAFVDKYKSDPGFSTQPDLSTFWIVLNQTKNDAFKSINLRKAISLALDRKAFVDTVLKNGSLPATGAVPPTLNSGVEGKDFRSAAGVLLNPTPNKDEAKKAWDAAKVETGKSTITIKMLIDDGDLSKRIGEAIQAMLQDALPGLKVELDQVTFAIRLDRTKKKDYEMVFAGWGPDYNDSTTFLDLWKSDSSFNDPGWKKPEYDDLLKRAAAEPDVNKRLDLLVSAEKLLMTELPIIPVYHRTVARVSKPWVKGVYSLSIGPGLNLKTAYVEGKK
ncbi:MAG: dppE [Firmicutes bacterium]|nr:dppE [Bacillota bacterium]